MTRQCGNADPDKAMLELSNVIAAQDREEIRLRGIIEARGQTISELQSELERLTALNVQVEGEVSGLKGVIIQLQADNQKLERLSIDMEDLLHKVGLSINECLTDVPESVAEKLRSLSKEIDEFFVD